MTVRLRRSVLYMPGANARALDKARTLPTDGLILDLEDAVAPDAKASARAQVVRAVRAGGYGKREVVVRVNALSSPWGNADVTAVAALTVDAVLFPKVESARQVSDAAQALDQAGARPELPLWVMIETPLGVLRAEQIAAAHPRLAVLVMGTSDLAKELRVPHTASRSGLLAALCHCVLAARAHGLDVVDGVHLDLADDAALRVACAQGRELGFDGKTLIHPRQIEAANRAFTPAPEAVENARAILAAWDQAREQGKGVAVVDGRLVENLHVEQARRTLALAEAADALTPVIGEIGLRAEFSDISRTSADHASTN